jgi:hypothetical protein
VDSCNTKKILGIGISNLHQTDVFSLKNTRAMILSNNTAKVTSMENMFYMFYKASDVVASPSTLAYEFAPDANNVVGNYSPGVMTAAGTGAGSLGAAILAISGNSTPTGNVVLRDMGKTVKAPLSGAPSGPQYFFRQVQLISLSSAAAVGGGGCAGGTRGTGGGGSC